MHITVFVVLSSLVVKSMGHFVTDDHADRTIVEGVVCLWVKERGLKDAGRETDFVGGWIIIGVDGLRIHIPVVFVNRLSCGMVDLPFVPEAVTFLHIVIIRFRRINSQLAHIGPFVGISYLDIEGVEFQQGIHLGTVVHPGLCGNTLAQGDTEVFHQGGHALLRRGGEILLCIDFSKGLTHHAFHLRGGSAPEGMVFLASCHHLAVEIETGLCGFVVQQVGGAVDDAPFHPVAVCRS